MIKHTGKPVTITTEKKVAEIQEFILEDRRVTVETVARHFDISYGTAQDIMTNKLGMHRVSARWVPRLLLPDQMGQRVKRCHEYCQRYNDESENFLNRIITCDERCNTFLSRKVNNKTQCGSILLRLRQQKR